MEDRERVRYEMMGRVVAFFTKYVGDFAAGSEAKKRSAHLAGVVTQLDAEKAKQKALSATAKCVLVDALRLDVANITRTARAIAQEIPGFNDKFRAPENDADGDVLTAADAILEHLVPDPNDTPAQAAEKQADVAKFIAHELPATFVQDLASDRAAIGTSEEVLDESKGGGVNATSAVGRLIAAGMLDVRFLDAIVHNKYTRNADVLREWLSDSHIERLPKGKKKSDGQKPPQ